MGLLFFSENITKITLLVFNFMFVVCGIAILTGGAILVNTSEHFNFMLGNLHGAFEAPEIMLVIVGLFLFLIAFFGCCGTIRGSRRMLLCYVICLFVIFMIQSAISIYSVLNFSKLENKINTTLSQYFLDHVNNENTVLTDLELSLSCCGVNGPSDYVTVPMSCCVRQGTLACAEQDTYKTGCVNAATEFAAKALRIIAGVAIGMAVIEVIAMLLACAYSKDVERFDW